MKMKKTTYRWGLAVWLAGVRMIGGYFGEANLFAHDGTCCFKTKGRCWSAYTTRTGCTQYLTTCEVQECFWDDGNQVCGSHTSDDYRDRCQYFWLVGLYKLCPCNLIPTSACP